MCCKGHACAICHILTCRNNITGVIQFDMNGLKYINDNFGHAEGDKALAYIANLVTICSKRNMYAYRLGGDENLILCVNGTEKDLIDTISKFKDRLKQSGYYCSYGYSHRNDNKQMSLDALIKEAERKMYEDKERFYKNSPFERRKAEQGK